MSAPTGSVPDRAARPVTSLATAVPTIARKEFADAIRSRMLWGIVVIIAAMTSLSAGVSLLVPDVEADATMALGGASQFAGLLVPIMALIAAYLAIAGERESGSLKVLLGLPPSRGAVLAGKFLGRGGVVIIGVCLGYAVSGVVTFGIYGDLPAVAFIGSTALTALLGLVFVGIAVGISAATATRARAMTIAVAAYLGLTVLWDLVPYGVHLLVTGTMPGSGATPGWYLLLQSLSPTGAYNVLTQYLLVGSGGLEAATGGGPLPFYLDPAVFAALLLAWMLVPLAAGYRRFSRADL